MPFSGKLYAEGFAKRAAGVGPACERAASVIMGGQKTRQKAIGQGKSLLALASRFGAAILEAACEKALEIGGGLAVTVDQVECICAATYRADGDIEDSGEHAILRGKEYYDSKGDN